MEEAEINQVACYTSWYNIAQNYSHRYVTFESDWLPALAGLASNYASVLDDTYVYGLWSKDLYRGILFEQEREPLEGFEPHDSSLAPNWHDIPSWSWAALHRPVEWGPVKVDDKNVFCKLEMDHGASMLRLTGMLITLTSNDFWEMSILAYEYPRPGNKNEREGLEVTLKPDEWFVSIFEEEWTHSCDADMEGARNRGLVALRIAVLFMPVTLSTHSEGATVTGLLLCKRPGLEHGQYRRAGVACMLANLGRRGDTSLDLDEVTSILRAYTQPLDDFDVHETLGNGQYAITVL